MEFLMDQMFRDKSKIDAYFLFLKNSIYPWDLFDEMSKWTPPRHPRVSASECLCLYSEWDTESLNSRGAERREIVQIIWNSD